MRNGSTFLFEDDVYQTDGVAMGSLGPILAGIIIIEL